MSGGTVAPVPTVGPGAGLSYGEALAFWRAMHAEAVAQAARLTDDQLARPGPSGPAIWRRPHLAEVVTALVRHDEGHLGPQR